MGLDTTHDAFHGPYSYFMRFRENLMQAIGGPPLRSMRGFDGDKPWTEELQEHDLYPLLNHSDCDGFLTPSECHRIVRGIETLLNDDGCSLDEEMREIARRFAVGCERAAMAEEELEFN